MPVFRTVGYAGISSSSSLFDILSINLQELARAGEIQTVSLARKVTAEMHQFVEPTDFLDQLLVREGKPLISVSISVRGSARSYMAVQGLRDYIDMPQTDAGVVSDHAELLGLRLKSELAPVKPKGQAQQAPDPVEQLCWTVDIRYPGQKSRDGFVFDGGPFDFDKLELAYTAIVDAIVFRSKPAA